MALPNKMTFTLEAQPGGMFLLTSPQAKSLHKLGGNVEHLLASATTYLADALRYEAAQKTSK